MAPPCHGGAMARPPTSQEPADPTGTTPAEPWPEHGRRTGRRRRQPRKLSAQSLENAALYYLARFSAPSAHLRRVLRRRVDRALRVHGGDPAEGRRLVEELIERFHRSGLLDDTAYAAGRVESLRRRGASRTAIGRSPTLTL